MKRVSLFSCLSWSLLRNLFLRLGSASVFFVLARTVDPSELGIFSVIYAILIFFGILSEAGMVEAIIQKTGVGKVLVTSAVVNNFLISCFIFFALFLYANKIMEVLDLSPYTTLFRVSLIGFFLNSVFSIPQAFLRKKFEFSFLGKSSVSAMLMSGSVGIALVLNGAGIWSLVVQYLLMSFVSFLLIMKKSREYILLMPFPSSSVGIVFYNSFKLYWHESLKLLSFGSPIVLGKILGFFSTRYLEIYIFSVFGSVSLAVYVMGQRLYSLVMQLISSVLTDVYIPSFSHLQHSRNDLRRSYYTAMIMTAKVATPVFFGLAFISPEVVWLLYGANGGEVGDIASGMSVESAGVVAFLFSLLGSIQVLQFYNGAILTAIGKPSATLYIQIFKMVLVLLLCFFRNANTLHELVVSFIAAQIISSPFSFWLVRQYVGISVLTIIKSISPFFLASLFFSIIIFFSRSYFQNYGFQPIYRVFIFVILSAFLYVLFLSLFFPMSIRYFFRDLMVGRFGEGSVLEIKRFFYEK